MDKNEPSFTVETLRHFARHQPDATLFLIMGADMFHDLPNWREPAEICRLATPLVAYRLDAPAPCFDSLAEFITPEELERIRAHAVHMPVIDISSTKIRDAIATGASIRFQVPKNVESYISSRGLYAET